MGQVRWLALASFALLTLSSQLAFAICGDGNREAAEACDDGNLVNGDGCSSTCQLEAQFVCESSNFSLQVAEALPGGTQPGWVLAADRLGVTQTQNSAAGVYTTNMPADIGEITFTLRVGTTDDDDHIGWTVGYDTGELRTTGSAGDRDFLAFNWKQAAQANSSSVNRPAGLWLTRVTGPVTDANLWSSTGNAVKVAEAVGGLGTAGWVDNTAYRVRMRYTTSRIQVWVTRSSNTSVSGSFGGQPEVLAFDLTGSFPAGNFGFWTQSQEQCQFRLLGLNGAAPGADVCSVDTDTDGVKDRSDGDADGDGIPDSVEAPGFAGNPNADTDGDGIPDWNDPDHIPGGCAPTGSPARCASLPLIYDRDQDGIPNHLDLDSDGDGLPDTYEAGLLDLNLNGKPDLCVSVNAFGLCVMGGLVGAAPNTDGDALPDYLDVDSDGDGILDAVEAFDTTGDLIANVVASGFDTLGNGIDDAFDPRCTAALCGGRVGVISTLPDSDNNNIPNHLQTCGDGYKIVAEACDDGNTTAGDGCSNVCVIEAGYVCDGTPLSVCETVCGDGIVAGAEACDDNNLASGDGCSAMCAVEADYTCPVAGGQCLTVDLLVPASMARLATNSVTYSGTSTANAQVTVIVRDSLGVELETFTATANGSGAWTSTRPLADGAYSASASVTTTGGTYTDAPNSFLVDATAPVVALTAPADGTLTNDTTPTIAGSAGDVGGLAAMAPVTVTVLDAQAGLAFSATPTVGLDGLWSVDTSALADGVYTVTATALDASGNTTTTLARTFTIDTIAPALALVAPANGAETNDNTPTISGTAEVGASIVVSIDGNALTAVIAADGTWSVTAPTLADGPHTVSVIATDAANNPSAPATASFTVDTVAPLVALGAPADGALTGDATPTISGVAEVGATVTVSVDGAEIGVAVVAGDGTWSITAPSLADGAHTVSVVATDAANNPSAPATVSFTVDLTAPAVALTAPAADAIINDTTPTIAGSASDANGLDAVTPVTVTVLDAQNAVAFSATPTVGLDGLWSVDASVLADGVYTVTATATDAAGNELTTAARTFTIDTAAPALALVAPLDGALTNDSTPTISGTAEVGASVVVTIDGSALPAVIAADGTWSVTAPTLVDGAHAVSVVATDAANNPSAPVTASFTVDTTAPAVALVAPVDGDSFDDNTPTISGTAEVGASIVVSIDGNALPAVVAADGTWSVTAPTLADGPHTVSVIATDAASNPSAPATASFIVDTTAPAVALIAPADDAILNDETPTLSGTASDAGGLAAATPVTVTVLTAQGLVAFTANLAVDGAGAWSIDADALADGVYSVTATATDAAGNTTTSDARSFLIDTLAPVVTLIAPADDATLANPRPTITGTTEPGSSVVVTVLDAQGAIVLDETVVADAMSGAWQLPLVADLIDGSYTLSAVATDLAGNEGVAATSSFAIDSTALALSILAPTAGQSLAQSQPPISGTTAPGAEVTVTLRDAQSDVVEALTVTADGAGAWSVTPTMALADGSYEATATVANPAGIVTTEVVGFTIDTVAPMLSLLTPVADAALNDPSPAITGTSEPGAQIEVELRDAAGDIFETLTAIAGPLGQWSVTPAMPLADGDYSVVAVAFDDAGNETTQGPRDFTIDTLAPALTITAPTADELFIVRDVTVSGVSDPDQELVLTLRDAQDDVVSTQTITADAQGDWSASLANLQNGTYTVTASAVDAAGNTSDATVGFVVDSVQPELLLTSPTQDLLTNAPNLVVTGQASADAEVVIIIRDSAGNEVDRLTPTLDDSAMMPLASFDTTSTMPLADGAYTVEVIVTRPNGLSTTETRAVVIDTMAPAVTISQPGMGAVVGVNNPMISGMSEPGATVIVRLDGQEVGTVTADAAGAWTLAIATPLAEGAHTLSVTATDAAGNVSEPATRDFTVDTSAPMVMLTAPAQGQELAPGEVVVSGIAAPGATVSIVIDGEVVGMATADASGAWSFTSPALAEGAHTVEARVTNEAGTTGTSGEISFEVREPMMSAPVTITSPGPGATLSGPGVTVSGTGTPGAMVTVTVGDQSQTVTVGEDGMWSVTFDEVPQGRTTISARDGRTSVTLTVTVGQPQSPYSDAQLVGGGCAQGSGQAPASAGLWLLGLGLLYRARRKRRA